MELGLALLGAAFLGWLARWPEVGRLEALLRESDQDAKAATDRLLAAWRDGYSIPEVSDESYVELEPLHPDLVAIVTSYPDPAAAAKIEAAIRRKLNSGRTVDQIVMDAEVGEL